MTIAVICGLVILIVCAAATFILFRYVKMSPDNRVGIIMLACALITVAGALFRVGELPGERLERAKKCIAEGYALSVNGHEIFAGSADLDLFTVTSIDDEHSIVNVITNEKSPEWALEYNDQ